MNGTRPRKRASLTWRMTVAFSVAFALLLAAFLAANYWTTRRTLIGAGSQRAEAAAQELAGTLGRSTASVLAQVQRTAEDPALALAIEKRSAETADAARQVLAPRPAPGARRAEIFDTRGQLVVLVAQPKQVSNATGLQEFPAPPGPPVPGISQMRAAGSTDYYFEVTSEIRRPERPNEVVGYVRRLGQFTTSAASSIQRLLGRRAILKVGTAGGVWTDFGTQVPAPPVQTDDGTFEAADGSDWVGALVPIEGTPWSVWVGYPEDQVVGPMRRFFVLTLPVALLILAVGFEIVRRLTRRLTRPLSELTAATDAVAAGDYSMRVHVRGEDELARIGASFNTMMETLARDAAARADAETALRRREEVFRSLFATNPLPMWVYDLESFRFLEVNAAAVRQYGYTREEFLAMTITEIRPPEEVPGLVEMLREPRGDLTPLREWRHRRKDGSIIDVLITSHRLVFEGREAALVVSQDVTARRRLEDQLRQAQKMEAVGQLAGGVAHDFNNLLTAILGSCELLLDQFDLDDTRREELVEIQRAGRSAADLTRQLLAFSRKQVLQPQVLDLNAIVSGMQGMLSRVIGEHIQLEARTRDDVHPVKLDRSQIEQVLMNLAVNARDAMPAGGKLTIETARVELDADYAAGHREVAPGPYVMLAVSDTGAGMDAATQARMFEPFFTTKARGEGTGLGLATIYGIVKQSGGTIEVYSEPGRGTTFKLYFPLAAGPVAAAAQPAAARRLEGTETILVVEDQKLVRAIAARILGRHGYKVIEAETGEEGLRTLKESTAEIKLVLTDLVLPDMTGADLIARADLTGRDVRVLYTSGYADESVVRSGIIDAGAPFLQKPYAAQDLLRRVRELLDGPPQPA